MVRPRHCRWNDRERVTLEGPNPSLIIKITIRLAAAAVVVVVVEAEDGGIEPDLLE
jgi:hypothetical protein